MSKLPQIQRPSSCKRLRFLKLPLIRRPPSVAHLWYSSIRLTVNGCDGVFQTLWKAHVIYICGLTPGRCGGAGSTSRIDPTRFAALYLSFHLDRKRENFPTNETAHADICYYVFCQVAENKTTRWDFRVCQNKIREQKINKGMNSIGSPYTQCYLFAKTVYLSVV